MSTNNLPSSTLTYVQAIRDAQAQAMREDERVMVMGLDVDDHKGIQGTTAGLLEEFGADRVFTTPLSEDAMTGVAIGSAMAGLKPVHVHIRMDFLLLCMNQLINIAAKAHYMYGGEVNVPMVVRTNIGKSWGQGAQHSQGLHSMFMHVPGLKVVAPSNAYDAKGLLLSAIDDPNPVIFTEHRLLYNTDSEVPDEAYRVELGKAKTIRQSARADVTIVAISNMVMEALRAAELLEQEGVQVDVIDPVTLSPLDMAPVMMSLQRTRRLLVVDNAWLNCGASAEIVARACEQSSYPLNVNRIGFAATTCPTTPSLENAFYPNPVTIAREALGLIDKKQAQNWQPAPDKAELVYQMKFKGPF